MAFVDRFRQGQEPKKSYDTPLTSDEEREFQAWKQKYAPNDSGEDYDLRGAFKAGLKPDPKTGHWPDTFKKPNHPTFSNESKYATGTDAAKAGHWEGNTFIPPSPPSGMIMYPGRGYETMPRDPNYPDEIPQQTRRRFEQDTIMSDLEGDPMKRAARLSDYRDPTAAMFSVSAATKKPIVEGYGVGYEKGPLDPGYVYQPSQRPRSQFLRRFNQKREELPQPIMPRREFRTEPTLEEEAGPYRSGRTPSMGNLASDVYNVGKTMVKTNRPDKTANAVRNALRSYEGFGGYDINEPVPTEPLSIPHSPFRPRRVERKEKAGGGRQ